MIPADMQGIAAFPGAAASARCGGVYKENL